MTRSETVATIPETQRLVIVENAKTVALQTNSPPRAGITCAQLATIAVPVLVFGGDNSPRLLLMANDAMARCLRSAERVVVPNARHLVHSMNPTAYNDALLSFLDAH